MFIKIGLVVLFAGCAATAQEPIIVPALGPDLVILEVTFDSKGAVEFPTQEFTIVIKNIGNVAANIPTRVAVLYTYGIPYGTPVIHVFGVANTPQIAAGSTATVKISKVMQPIGFFCVIVIVDAPVPGKPLGQLTEIAGGTPKRSEMNNGFVFFLDVMGGPRTYKNPAFNP